MKDVKLGSSMTERVRTWIGLFVATHIDPVYARAHREASEKGVLIHA